MSASRFFTKRIKIYNVMKKATKYDEEYRTRDIKSAIEGEELLNRLRSRIKSLFK